ncbi:MAG: hypothetical protein ACTHOG_02585 [Marmoricola sp.]
MRVRLRLWWDFLPFTVKAGLIVLIAGLTVSATARATTLADRLYESAPLAGHELRTSVPVDQVQRTEPGVTLTLTSFYTAARTPGRSVRTGVAHGDHRTASRPHRLRHPAATRTATPLPLNDSVQSHAASAVDTLRRAVPSGSVNGPTVPIGR